jgi:hypothetical protein
VQTIEQIICEGDKTVTESGEEEEDSVVPSYTEALNALATFRAFIDNVPKTIVKSIREVESFSMAKTIHSGFLFCKRTVCLMY